MTEASEVPMDSTGQFPDMGSLCLDFLNSEWGDFRGRFRVDRLLQPTWLLEFLDRWNLRVTSSTTPDTLDDLVELRTHMRHIVEALHTGNSPAADVDTLNAILLAVPPMHHLVWSGEKYEMEEVIPARDWRWAKAEIVASFANLLVNADSKRLKVCENPYCRCYFYDETKSRTQRWCINKCANLWKARRFRARQREENSKVSPKPGAAS